MTLQSAMDQSAGGAGAAVVPSKAHRTAPWKSVALPSEHGGWSLTLEPVALGLLVSWSWPGLALGLAALLAFLARTPLKVVLVDRWRHRTLTRTTLASKVAAAEVLVLVLLASYAATAGERGFWLPLAVAAPFIALELWYDMRSRGRRLVPELSGSIGIGAVATAIALAGGASDQVAWGLWAVIALRSLAAIPYVRTQIQRAKQRSGSQRLSDGAQLIATSAAIVAWLADLVPGPAAIAISVIGLFNVVALRTTPRRAVVIGIQQVLVGAGVIAVTAAAINLT